MICVTADFACRMFDSSGMGTSLGLDPKRILPNVIPPNVIPSHDIRSILLPFTATMLGVNHRIFMAAGVASVFLLTACSSDEAAEPASEAAATTKVAAQPTTTKSAGQTLDNSPAALGETVGMKNDSMDVFTMSVDAIEVDGACPDDVASAPKNGHLLIANMTVTTGPDYKPSVFPDLLNPIRSDWSIVGSDGVTETNISTPASYGCAYQDFPEEMNPNAKYQFAVAFDTKNANGTLVYELRAGSSKIGWRWNY